jgi:uncharacterized protein (TIGR00369 family)
MTVQNDGVPPEFVAYEPERFFYQAVGPIYIRRREREVACAFRVAERHVNIAGICHGGMLFSLMDIQMGFGANLETGTPGFLATVNMTVDFMAAVEIGQWVEASSRVVKQTRSLVFTEGRLHADGEVVLRANAVLKVPRRLAGVDVDGMLEQS